jgi:hypothetical protein
VGKRACVCHAGHRSHCICGDARCDCHSAAAYGLQLDFREMVYQSVNAEYDDLLMLEVKV